MALNYTSIRGELVKVLTDLINPHTAWPRFLVEGKVQSLVATFSDATLKAGIMKTVDGLTAFTAWYVATLVPAAVKESGGSLTTAQAAKGAGTVYNVLKKYASAVQTQVVSKAAEMDPSWFTDETAAMVKAVAKTTTAPVAPVTITATKISTPATAATSSVLPIAALAVVAFLFLR